MLNQLLEQENQSGALTHMPFLARDETGREILFFCRADAAHIWKIHYARPGEEAKRLGTGTTDEIVECSPTAWHDDTGWHISFIAGGGSDTSRYQLYRMDGPSLDRLYPPVAIQNARTGFIYKDRLVYGEIQDVVHLKESSGDKVIELPGVWLYRLSYVSDQPDKLLISGQWIKDEDLFCLEYDLATGHEHILECDGLPAYKCAILGDTVVFAERCGEHFESRRLCCARETQRYPNSSIRSRMNAPESPATATPKRCGCRGEETTGAPTRPSCIECVEKHLGAAYVLLTETADGYAHRLRAIGHLHEAEDESQEWSMVHRAIRDARKEYQTKGTMPDWDLFEFLVNGVRDYVK